MPDNCAVLDPRINADAEIGLVGAVLHSPELLSQCGNITAAHFTVPLLRAVWQAIHRLEEDGRFIEPDNIHALISDKYSRDLIVGLAQTVVVAFEFEMWIQKVRECFCRRQISEAQIQLAGLVSDPAVTIAELADRIGRLHDDLEPARDRQSIITVKESIAESYAELEAIQNGSADPGITTGFSEFDQATSGLHKGDLIIIGARPKVGKTSIATNILDHIACRLGRSVLLFSLEMSHRPIRQRLLCSHANVSFHSVRSRIASAADFAKLRMASEELAAVNFGIVGAGTMNIREIVSTATRYKRQSGLDLIAIDYIQRISGPKSDNRNTELTRISGALKGLAVDLDIPIIALAQLNRDVEKRGKEGRPKASDLRDSGVLEQDADLVVLLHRERNDTSLLSSAADLIIDMQRNGPPDLVHLYFNAKNMKFENTTQRLPGSVGS